MVITTAGTTRGAVPLASRGAPEGSPCVPPPSAAERRCNVSQADYDYEGPGYDPGFDNDGGADGD